MWPTEAHLFSTRNRSCFVAYIGLSAVQDFCSKHNIVSEIEEINADYINTAYERLAKNDVHYRFVIDVQGTMVQ